jgi:HEAT repeat protein
VAQCLAAYADRSGAVVARQLLDDPSAEVQRQTVMALASWPLGQAGPILLEALGKPSLVTRKAAADQLAVRWPPAAGFPVEAAPPRRAELLAPLQNRFREQFARRDRDSADPASQVRQAAAVSTSAGDPATVESVAKLLRAGDIHALGAFGPGLLESLEQIALDRHQTLPPTVYHDVLPLYGPEFSALDRLAAPDVAQRRQAAGELAELSQKQPLGRLAVARLCELTATEADVLVWRSVLEAVSADPGEASSRLAYAALGHESSEVRRRACENLAAHPAPGHARFLLPRLDDGSQTVVIAAVRALGSPGVLDDPAPLRKLLASSNEEIELETAAALSRLQDPAGTAALERITYSADPGIRARSAQVMGSLGDPMFTASLVRLLDDHRTTVNRAALAALPKIAGRDIAQAGDGPAPGTTEQIRRWKQWFADGSLKASAKPLR